MDAEREYNEKMHVRKKAMVESAGITPKSYTDSIMDLVNQGTKQPPVPTTFGTVNNPFAGKEVHIVMSGGSKSGGAFEKQRGENGGAPDNRGERNGEEGKNSEKNDGAKKVPDNNSISNNKPEADTRISRQPQTIRIRDAHRAQEITHRRYQNERRVTNHEARAIRTGTGIVSGIVRSGMYNEDHSGRGLVTLMDNGGDILLSNKKAVAKGLAVAAAASNPVTMVGLVVANRIHHAVLNAEISSFATKHAGEEAKKALKDVNKVLTNHGYARLTELKTADINQLIKNIKGSNLSKETKDELINALKNAKNWKSNLEFDVAKRNANRTLQKYGFKPITGKGSELAINARKQLRALKKAGAPKEAIDATKKMLDIGNAETFHKGLRERLKAPANVIKGLFRVYARYMKQTDAGRGAALMMNVMKMTKRTLQKTLRTVQSIAKGVASVWQRAQVSAMRNTATKLRASRERLKNLRINPSDKVLRNNKTTGRMIRRNERLEKRNTKFQKRSDKRKNRLEKKGKRKNKWSIRGRWNNFKREARKAIAKRLLGDKLYGFLSGGAGIISNIINLIKSIIRKIIFGIFAILLLNGVAIIAFSAVMALIGSFDLSGESKYAKLKRYVVELYRADLSYMVKTTPFTEADQSTNDKPLGCSNIAFKKEIDKDKYDQMIEDNTDEEFDHLATSNLCEVMSMTYIHKAQEMGEDPANANPSDVFNKADYSDLRDYTTSLWLSSHHFKITYTGDQVSNVVYTTYYFDKIFEVKKQTKRWKEIVYISHSTAASGKSVIYDKLKEMGYSDYAAAGILGNMEIESTYNPWRLESDYTQTDSPSEEFALAHTKTKEDLNDYTYLVGLTDLNHRQIYGDDKDRDENGESPALFVCGVGLCQWSGGNGAAYFLYGYDYDNNKITALCPGTGIVGNYNDEADERWTTLDYQMKFLDYSLTHEVSGQTGWKELYKMDFKNMTPDNENSLTDEQRIEFAGKCAALFEDYYERGADKNARIEAAKEVYGWILNRGKGKYYIFSQADRTDQRYAIFHDSIEEPDMLPYEGEYPWAAFKGYDGACGLIAMADIVSTFFDEPYTPMEMSIICGAGNAVNSGVICSHFGLQRTWSSDPEEIMDAIENGAYVLIHCCDYTPVYCYTDGTPCSSSPYGDEYTHFIAGFKVIDRENGILLTSSYGFVMKEFKLDSLKGTLDPEVGIITKPKSLQTE